MTMRALLSAALPALILLGACNPAEKKAEAPAAAKAPDKAELTAGAPAPWTETPGNDEAVWHFWQTEEGTHIAYSIPDSDDAGPALHCQSGTGQISISYWADHEIKGEPGASETTRLRLTSGKVAREYEALGEREELYGGATVSASTTIKDPVIVEFARTGVLQMTAYGMTSTMPPADKATVGKFMKGCAKP